MSRHMVFNCDSCGAVVNRLEAVSTDNPYRYDHMVPSNGELGEPFQCDVTIGVYLLGGMSDICQACMWVILKEMIRKMGPEDKLEEEDREFGRI